MSINELLLFITEKTPIFKLMPSAFITVN